MDYVLRDWEPFNTEAMAFIYNDPSSGQIQDPEKKSYI